MGKVAVCVVVLVVAGWMYVAQRGIEVVVHNVGAEPLVHATVEVTGATYALGDIAPGDTASVYVRPTSESSIAVTMKSPTNRLVIFGYLEPNEYGSVYAELTREHVVRVSRLGLASSYRRFMRSLIGGL